MDSNLTPGKERFGKKIDGDFSSIVISARLDISTYVEHFLKLPPAMFHEYLALEKWAKQLGLKINILEGSGDHIALISGEICAPDGTRLSYRQLWALASHTAYRNVWANWHSNSDEVPRDELGTLHADHVINKARLKQNYPHAWVMLFPVPGRSNSPFGSSIESDLDPIPTGKTQLDLDVLVLFKLFSAEYPKDENELEVQIGTIFGQLPKATAEDVKQAIKALWRKSPTPSRN